MKNVFSFLERRRGTGTATLFFFFVGLPYPPRTHLVSLLHAISGLDSNQAAPLLLAISGSFFFLSAQVGLGRARSVGPLGMGTQTHRRS